MKRVIDHQRMGKETICWREIRIGKAMWSVGRQSDFWEVAEVARENERYPVVGKSSLTSQKQSEIFKKFREKAEEWDYSSSI